MVKILLILSILVSAATAGIGYFNRTQFVQTKDELAAAKTQVISAQKTLEAEKKKLLDEDARYKELTVLKEKAESQAATSKAEADSAKKNASDITAKLAAREGDFTKQLNEIKAKDAEISKLKSEAESPKAAPTAPTSNEDKIKLEELSTAFNQSQTNLNEARAKLEVLERKQKDSAASTARKNLFGRILAVNQAWNFVVLNIGDRSGILTNTELLVKRGSTMIGKVRITTVEPSTSIAEIIPNSLTRGMSIQPGDDVIYKAPED
jgi:DNA repair exonuclease SbcCD ATPase subunit